MKTATTTVTDAPSTPTVPYSSGCAYLRATLPKAKDEILKVTHISGPFFRATWFCPMRIGDSTRDGNSGLQGKISKSLFIRSTDEETAPLARQ